MKKLQTTFYQLQISKLKFIILTLLIASCSPMSAVTTTPAVVMGVYDEVGKREKWQQRAQAGDSYSQFELAESYISSIGQGATNVNLAAKWYCESAKKGNPNAIIELGKLFEGTKKAKFFDTPLESNIQNNAQNKNLSFINKTKALGLYMMSDWRASLEGSQLKNKLQPQLSPEQVSEAQNYAYYFEFHNCDRILSE